MSCCSSCGFNPCRCGCGFTTLEGPAIGRTLIASLTGCVDQIRDLNTCLGARPYQVSLIWTRWSGGERGAGIEEIIRREPILPTPKLDDMAKVRRELQMIGMEELGFIRISEISPRYTEDFLMGLSDDGRPIPEDQNFFWEVHFPRADGPGPRRRFFPKAVPSYMATKFQWHIDLLKASEDRTRDGELR